MDYDLSKKPPPDQGLRDSLYTKSNEELLDILKDLLINHGYSKTLSDIAQQYDWSIMAVYYDQLIIE